MNKFTIIIPTHDHAFALRGSIRSVLNQTEQSFTLYVIGDGQGPDTDAVMTEICTWDTRINYSPNEKGPGYGEFYRHNVLQTAKSKYVAYLGDDDFWLPNHLETLEKQLDSYDYVHTLATEYNKSDNILYHIDDINHPETYSLMANRKYNFFGLSCISHRLDSYHKLPHGWKPKFENLASDYSFFIQWIETGGMTFKTIPESTTLKLPSRARKNVKTHDRITEFDYWMKIVSNPRFLTFNKINFERSFYLRQDIPKERLLHHSRKYCRHFQLKSSQLYFKKLRAFEEYTDEIKKLEDDFRQKKNSLVYKILMHLKIMILGNDIDRMLRKLNRL